MDAMTSVPKESIEASPLVPLHFCLSSYYFHPSLSALKYTFHKIVRHCWSHSSLYISWHLAQCHVLEEPSVGGGVGCVCVCVCVCVCARACTQSLSHVWLFATTWTIACQAPLSWGFPSKNIGLGCHSLLQGIFLTQGLNPHLLHCRRILYPLHQLGSPTWCEQKCISLLGNQWEGYRSTCTTGPELTSM